MDKIDASEMLQPAGELEPDKCQCEDPTKDKSRQLEPSVEVVELSDKKTLSQEQVLPTTVNPPANVSGDNAESSNENTNQTTDEPTPAPTKSPLPQQTVEIRDEVKDKKKEDDKLSIYKALAIKLKKELVKTRDELQKLRLDSSEECSILKEKVKTLEENLETLTQTSATNVLTLESRVKSLKEQLENSESDLKNIQDDFENYKVRASKIMQQNNSTCSASNKTFEEERYKQMKELNDSHSKRISTLESQLSKSLERNHELEKERKLFQDELELLQEKLRTLKILDNKYETLKRENENLKLALAQFRTKLKDPITTASSSSQNCDELSSNPYSDTGASENVKFSGRLHNTNLTQNTASNSNLVSDHTENMLSANHHQQDDNVRQISPSAFVKDDSPTNSSSSYDGSTSGYVHIKPTTFEIISRASVLEDAQNQIDNLTKAYLDSENTNSLLSDQVRALKEEIRRLQRGTERMDLAENLEYLKNVVFKFISLDSGQLEQKQRLVPVLSTVLKLSPDETAKLNALAMADKPSMASSFFKL